MFDSFSFVYDVLVLVCGVVLRMLIHVHTRIIVEVSHDGCRLGVAWHKHASQLLEICRLMCMS